jgi:hypothetical protein
MPVLSADHCCAVCGAPTTLRCARCSKQWYCSRDHQSEHWKSGHKLECGNSTEAPRPSEDAEEDDDPGDPVLHGLNRMHVSVPSEVAPATKKASAVVPEVKPAAASGAGTTKETDFGADTASSVPLNEVIAKVKDIYLDAYEASAGNLKYEKRRFPGVPWNRMERLMAGKQLLIEDLYARLPTMDGITQEEFVTGVEAGHAAFTESNRKRIEALAESWKESHAHDTNATWDPEGPDGPMEFHVHIDSREIYTTMLRRIEYGAKAQPALKKTDWAIGLSKEAAAEWFVDCYRLRINDDYHVCNEPRAIYAAHPTPHLLMCDFYFFCMAATNEGVVPAGFDWKMALKKAAKLLPYPFDEIQAVAKYGPENMYDGTIGGRSLRFTNTFAQQRVSEKTAKEAREALDGS